MFHVILIIMPTGVINDSLSNMNSSHTHTKSAPSQSKGILLLQMLVKSCSGTCKKYCYILMYLWITKTYCTFNLVPVVHFFCYIDLFFVDVFYTLGHLKRASVEFKHCAIKAILPNCTTANCYLRKTGLLCIYINLVISTAQNWESIDWQLSRCNAIIWLMLEQLSVILCLSIFAFIHNCVNFT